MFEALVLEHFLRTANPDPRTHAPTVACFMAEAQRQSLPPQILLAVMQAEGGRVGTRARNKNSTYDYGPMQINSSWVRDIAKQTHAPPQDVERALIYDGCFNIAAGAWILRTSMSMTGSFWYGVGHYNSATPGIRERYMLRVKGRLDYINRSLSAPSATQKRLQVVLENSGLDTDPRVLLTSASKPLGFDMPLMSRR